MSDKDSGKMQADSTKPQPPKRQPWWKIAVFALVMLMVVGAASYAIITRHINVANATLDRSNIPQIGSDRYISNIYRAGDLAWTESLRTTFIENDFVFVILLDNDIELNKTLTKRISDAVAKIEAEGTRVETITMGPDAPEFSATMHRMRLGQLPTVLAISSSGNGAIITGDITENDILKTYLGVVEPPPPICVPGSGCCGGGSSSDNVEYQQIFSVD